MTINLANATIIAADHTIKRTLGAHVGDMFNVKGFGALGDNVTNDAAAIQAAVDAAIAAGGGTVYFPVATAYKISSAINFDNDTEIGVRFLGEIEGTLITGTFDGYLLDRSLASPNNTNAMRIIERLSLINGYATGGCIQIGSSIGAVIRNCRLSAHIGITTEDSVGVSSVNTLIQDCQITGRKNYVDANGIIIGGGGCIIGTDVHGHNVGVRAYGSGLYIGGGRMERCSQAILLGLDSGGNDVGMHGIAIAGHTFEGNWTAIDFEGTVSGFSISGIYVQGHDSSNAGPGGSFDAGEPVAEGSNYGFRVRADNASNGIIQGVTAGNWHDNATFLMEDATARANILVTGVSVTQSGGAGVAWDIPSEAHTARFLNCNILPVYTFDTLPSSPLEGDEYNISDSNTATWGATAAGGGSDNVLVRYNGSNWTVVGI